MPHETAAPHVLVVDDETDLADEINDYLLAHHFKAQAVSNGEDALQRLDADPSISVLLSDIRMPDLNGLELADAALSRRTDANPLEVVMLTGHGTVDDATRALRSGAVDFLQKPIALETIAHAVRRAAKAAADRQARWQELQSLRLRANGTAASGSLSPEPDRATG